jgi:hypothetical protein
MVEEQNMQETKLLVCKRRRPFYFFSYSFFIDSFFIVYYLNHFHLIKILLSLNSTLSVMDIDRQMEY